MYHRMHFKAIPTSSLLRSIFILMPSGWTCIPPSDKLSMWISSNLFPFTLFIIILFSFKVFSTLFFVVQSLSHVWLFVTLWTAAPLASLSFTIPELVQTHVHWVGDAIQPSRPLSFPSPPAFTLSQHHGLFQWVGSLHQMAKVLELQIFGVIPTQGEDVTGI